jgi:hypothetical protein
MTVPNLPDNIHKFLLIAGLVLIVYSFFEYQKTTKNYNSAIDEYHKLADNAEILILENEYALEKMERKANFLSKKYDIENPISNNDTIVSFTRKITGTQKELEVSETMNELWNSYTNQKLQLKIEKTKFKRLDKNIKFTKKENSELENFYMFLSFLGASLLYTGYNKWKKEQKNRDTLINYEIIEKGKIFTNCQSCGKTFSSIVKYGLLENLKKQFAFCSNCYDKGKFIENLTREDFELMKKEAVEKQNNWFSKRLISQRFDNLERWNENNYK